MNNNKIELIGRIASEIVVDVSNSTYEFTIETKRRSSATDKVKCEISREDISFERLYQLKSCQIKAIGKLYTEHTGGDNKHLRIFAHLTQIEEDKNVLPNNFNTNIVYLECYVVRQPVFRITPRGLAITDLFVACNHDGRSEYVPVICWNKCAESARYLTVGDKISIFGRLQSREYEKTEVDEKYDRTAKVTKTAYELSCIYFAKCK